MLASLLDSLRSASRDCAISRGSVHAPAVGSTRVSATADVLSISCLLACAGCLRVSSRFGPARMEWMRDGARVFEFLFLGAVPADFGWPWCSGAVVSRARSMPPRGGCRRSRCFASSLDSLRSASRDCAISGGSVHAPAVRSTRVRGAAGSDVYRAVACVRRLSSHELASWVGASGVDAGRARVFECLFLGAVPRASAGPGVRAVVFDAPTRGLVGDRDALRVFARFSLQCVRARSCVRGLRVNARSARCVGALVPGCLLGGFACSRTIGCQVQSQSEQTNAQNKQNNVAFHCVLCDA
jgi:hypothetical protein